MKAAAEITPTTLAPTKSRLAVFSELVKARLTLLVLLTAAVGFYLGSSPGLNLPLLIHALAGTGLLAAGAAALNQFLERDFDARMRRTQDRPLPSGRMQPETVLLFGGACGLSGLVYLALAVNLLTSLLGAVTLVSYLFIYTPLKRITWLNTIVGAVPGGLPPLMGWTAARGELALEGWALFGLLAFWQVPHFMAIAWLYREEYSKAGFVMLPAVDPDGSRTGWQAISHAAALLAVSVLPFALGLVGVFYLGCTLLLGAGFLACAVVFRRQLHARSARRLFLASILYLPLNLIMLVLDKAG
ncbi:MAG: heme o synthase [Verrucomicrobia bacterium]|jgi:protoheme IX farnesyltransferase|nr:heme o synthase [Verrucomicrobiota bacterium]